MHTWPRAFALVVVISLIATTSPIGLAGPLPLSAAASTGGKAMAPNAILQQFSTDGQAPVGPGVTHTWGRIVTGSGQQVVHVVNVQPGAPGITFQAALSNDAAIGLERSTTSANRRSVEGHRALAVINGDVWSSSSSGALAAPFGLHIDNGELMVAGPNARPTFGIDANGAPLIGGPVVSTNLVLPDGSFHGIDRINQHRAAGETVLYTPRFGVATDPDSSGVEVVFTGAPLPLRAQVNAPVTVAAVRPATGATNLDPSTIVVTGPSTSWLASLTPGQQLQLTISITAGWENVTEAIGGREFLLRGGSTFISPHPSIADQYHPRTAVGVLPGGGVALVTVDGRDAGYSTGVTDSELAALLREQGATDAINLDGGGSTAMAVREPGDSQVSIVNRPSDGSERSVANSLIVFSAAPTGPLATITLTPNNQSIFTTKAIDFDLFGQDAAFNPVAIPAGSVQWSVTGATGTFNSSGGFTAATPGNATITATVGTVSASVHLTIREDKVPPVAQPPVVRLVTGTTLGSTVPVNISWPSATDQGLGVKSYQLQQNINAKGWSVMPSGSALNRNASPSLTRNGNYRFAVRATDQAGNNSAWATGPSFRAVVLSESSGSITYRGGWSKITSPSYDGKAAMSTRTAGASATYTFVGNGFAWVSSKSPVRGLAKVYVDGNLVQTVSTYAPTAVVERLVFTQTWSKIGRHTVRIVAEGTKGHPRVDVDAFVVLASPTITVGAPPVAPTPTPPPNPTPTPTPKPTPKPTPSPTPKPSASPTPSSSASASPSTSPSTSPTASPSSSASASPSASSASETSISPQVLVGAGDIASCDVSADSATGSLIASIPGTVFTAGDNAYESGTASEFSNCYNPVWGSVKNRTRPVPGNHDYVTANAAGYFGYFGAVAGSSTAPYYAYNLGAWRIYALNSNCDSIGGCGAGSPEEAWLLNDLAANPHQCVAAIWHHPRYSSGEHGNNTNMDTLWRDLANAGADVVINGHDHDYERFTPMDASGAADPGGMREFVVGTGGAEQRPLGTIVANSEVRNAVTYGVLKLTLDDGSYSWEFVPIAGQTFTDSGSGVCH